MGQCTICRKPLNKGKCVRCINKAKAEEYYRYLTWRRLLNDPKK